MIKQLRGFGKVMASLLTGLCLVLVALSVSACKKAKETSATSDPVLPANTTAAVSSVKVQACSLITKEEVAAVQGATVLDTQSNENHDGSYLVSLCYYSSQEPNMSVSLAVTQPEPGDPKSNPLDYWKKTFGRFAAGAEAKESEEEERKGGKKEEDEERTQPPQHIEGLGDEAYWAANRFGGALYVLKKNFILRLSVGGPGDPAAKLERSRALAEKAVTRL